MLRAIMPDAQRRVLAPRRGNCPNRHRRFGSGHPGGCPSSRQQPSPQSRPRERHRGDASLRRRLRLHDRRFGAEILPATAAATLAGITTTAACARRCATRHRRRRKNQSQDDDRREGNLGHGADMRPLHSGFNRPDFTSSATTASISFRCAAKSARLVGRTSAPRSTSLRATSASSSNATTVARRAPPMASRHAPARPPWCRHRTACWRCPSGRAHWAVG
jgi:hypothetical protein